MTSEPTDRDASPWLLLSAPERLLERFDQEGGSRAVLALAAIFGGGMLPAVFAPEVSNARAQYVWSNPLTLAAVGLVIGLVWVQLIALPAGLLCGGARRRDGFAPARLAVAFSFLPSILVLPFYWWVRWFAGPQNALVILAYALPVTAVWGTWILARGLKSQYRIDSLHAAAATSGALALAPWLSALLGILPFAFVVFAIEHLYFWTSR